MAIEPVVRVSLENETVECAGAPGNLHRISDEAAQHPTNPVTPIEIIIVIYSFKQHSK